MNEKFEIEIYRRRLVVEMEGLTQLEASSLAQRVTDRMSEIEHRTKIADSSKLAIMTALEVMMELQREKDSRATEQAALERKIEEMSLTLRAAASHAPKK